LKEKTGLAVFNNTWTQFCNVREFNGVNPANFSFETTLRNTSTVEQSSCRKVIVTVLGADNAIMVPHRPKPFWLQHGQLSPTCLYRCQQNPEDLFGQRLGFYGGTAHGYRPHSGHTHIF
jgi:hypothetical protein